MCLLYVYFLPRAVHINFAFSLSVACRLWKTHHVEYICSQSCCVACLQELGFSKSLACKTFKSPKYGEFRLSQYSLALIIVQRLNSDEIESKY